MAYSQRYYGNSSQKKTINDEILIYQRKNEIRDFFLALHNYENDINITEIIAYLKDNTFSMYPYEFSKKYLTNHVDISYDNSCKMYFVLHDNKKMYFHQNWGLEPASTYYNSLLMEQDKESPHRYENKDVTVKDGDVIADMGAAEGIWALTHVEKASKIYLFECDELWIKALQKTFEPWKDKVVIVNKYISDANFKKEITIDQYFKNKPIDFIKADIEGAEIKLLKGGKDVLSKKTDIKLSLCAYHKKDDAIELKKILEAYGFITEFSKRYMLFIYDCELQEPYMRKGIIRAKK